MNTAAENFAAGYAAANQTIAILAGTLSAEALRIVTSQNIIKVHDTGRSDFDLGASSAWGDHQARVTREARIARYSRR
jgi:hypothetical protein